MTQMSTWIQEVYVIDTRNGCSVLFGWLLRVKKFYM
jgi:hypothetical protein